MSTTGGVRALLAVGLLLVVAGCASTRRDLDMAPTPASLPVFASFDTEGPDAAPAGQLLVAVSHAERRDLQPEGPWELVVRLRLENREADGLALVADSLQVVDADLAAFGPPRWDAPPASELARGESAVWSARLPFPDGVSPGGRALRGLQLQVEVRVGELRRVLDVSLARSEPEILVERVPYPARYGPYGRSWVGVGGSWSW